MGKRMRLKALFPSRRNLDGVARVTVASAMSVAKEATRPSLGHPQYGSGGNRGVSNEHRGKGL
jgi:hypothetical protein